MTIDRVSKLTSQVNYVIEESNKLGFLIMADSGSSRILYDSEDDSLIKNLSSICLQEKQSQRPEEIFKIITDIINLKKFVITIENKNNQVVPIELHLFINVSTFVLKNIYKNVIKQLIIDLQLTNFNCIIHLDYPTEKEIYTLHINEVKEKIITDKLNVKIKKY